MTLAPATASADTFRVPDRKPRVWTTDDGFTASVKTTGEKITRVPGLPGATTREAFVTLKSIATMTPPANAKDAAAMGTLQNGYQVSCSVNLQGVSPSVSLQGGLGAAFGIRGLIPSPDVQVQPSGSVTPSIGLQLAPGQVQTVLFDKKESNSQRISTVTREGHLNVDQCTGQVFIRSFGIFTVSSAGSNDTNAVYGRVITL